ncbi:MAG TPA: hypothetical protein VK363_10305 [Pyrinomonadaceae bacterium]|nr:hypothetical protein [Pyrinomonadaceae bacterium]
MKVSTPVRFLLSLAALLMVTSAAVVVRAQDARSALTNFPESQAVLYINAKRLINEAAPSIVPPEVLNKALNDARQFIDLNGLDYVIAGARLRGEVSMTNPPEVLLIVRGSFSADGLLSVARMAAPQGMYVQETHGGKTVNVFTLNKPAPADGASGDQPAKKFPVDQIAAVALDANTLAIGIPAYLRDAIDASTGGQGVRLKPELVDLAVRDANTLVSIVTDMPPAMSQHLRKFGMPPNAEIEGMIDAVRQVQLSVNMLPAVFGVQTILRMDGAEKAATLSGLINTGTRFLEGQLQKEVEKSGGKDDKAVSALQVLKTLTNTASGNEVALNVTFRQATLAEIVKKEMSKPKKKADTATSAAPGAKKGAAVRRRRPRRK